MGREGYGEWGGGYGEERMVGEGVGMFIMFYILWCTTVHILVWFHISCLWYTCTLHACAHTPHVHTPHMCTYHTCTHHTCAHTTHVHTPHMCTHHTCAHTPHVHTPHTCTRPHTYACLQVVSSLKHLTQLQNGAAEPKCTARQSIESKIGTVHGWEELLSCTGFHFISQLKKEVPATIVFPEHDDSGLLRKCQKHLEALLGNFWV